ncbi:MAG: LacI family transcriptional regulator [Ancrocorticia sp.]|nr:LacI family transcriptional regulator [Ancrocorticia sp.]MCI2193097.1 LacI family transcriptional regulator [Ancrocorticia sp.]MCI2199251.1 LacI family transcriptional regulator [Ancrocorticia sp.]
MGTHSATLEEVATLAGVSRSTVSRVINGSPSVSPAAKAAVEAAILKLHYVPNHAAKSLASKRAGAVTALIPEGIGRFFRDPFFGTILSGIESYLESTDTTLTILIASNATKRKTAAYVAGGNADGVLVLSHHTSDEFVEMLEDKVPVVYGGRPLHGAATKYFIDTDNVGGARMATEYLISQGRKHIATVSGPLDMPSGEDRLEGFLAALKDAGLEPGPIEAGDFTAVGGAEAMARVLERDRNIDGIFIASDLMARAAIDVMKLEGIAVPEQIAVVGFDDSVMATEGQPQITTVRQDSFEQGRLMAQILMERLAGKNPDHVITLPTTLVVRESA